MLQTLHRPERSAEKRRITLALRSNYLRDIDENRMIISYLLPLL